MCRYVAYYRVSTARQGRSGLGLADQKAAVLNFVGSGEIVAEIEEIESGKRNDRPKLAEAIATARAHKAVLIIAKLDRLARSVEFIARLMNSGVEFQAVDMPSANRLTVHILAAVAEAEREAISKRTKDALAQSKKALGGKREGQRAPTADERAAAVQAKAQKADARANDLAPIVAEIRAAGTTSASGIAKMLNARQIPTPKGGEWQAVQVQRLLARLDA